MQTVWQDLKYAARMLGKNPGFTAVAVLTLALGIGVNTTIFSLYNAIALRPLPVRDPAGVVSIYRSVSNDARFDVHSYPDFRDYREHNTVFSGLVAYSGAHAQLSGSGDPSAAAEPLDGAIVSGDYFSVLGVDAAIGRTFSAEEDQTPGAHPVVILGYELWQRRFAADANIAGKQITLNGLAYTVVGVTPRGFTGTLPETPAFWVPLMMQENVLPGRELLTARDAGWLRIVGRLKPGVTPAQAQAEMEILASQYTQPHAEKDQRFTLTVLPASALTPAQKGDVTSLAVLLMAAVGLILLMACANVANLMIARAVSRQKEMGVRLSLGATRGRLFRQLLTESTLIALLAGAGALLAAVWMSDLVQRVIPLPGGNALSLDVTPDARIVGFTIFLSLFTSVAFGFLPALEATRLDLTCALREEGSAFGRRFSRSRLRAALVVTQVAGSLILLVAAGLLLRALDKARSVDPGFEVKNLFVVSADLRVQGYDSARAEQFQRRTMARISALPGVKSVALAQVVPLGADFYATAVMAEGREPAAGAAPATVNFNIVSPNYFETLGIPLVLGRGFSEQDARDGALVAVITESMARRFWPGENPIGKRLRQGEKNPYREVIGVAKDTRSAYLWEAGTQCLYLPVSSKDQPDLKMLLRTERDAESLPGGVRGAVREFDGRLQVSVARLEDNMALWLWPSRVGAMLSGVLGFLALLLAAVGLYGIAAFTVSQRTREIGVRMALGAQASDIYRLLLGQGSRLVGMAIAIGLAAAICASSVLAKFLYGLDAMDAATIAGVALLLGVVALAAGTIPARRATRVDPLVALRYE
jgi:macrolide transport system ATP-binding/permease protein